MFGKMNLKEGKSRTVSFCIVSFKILLKLENYSNIRNTSVIRNVSQRPHHQKSDRKWQYHIISGFRTSALETHDSNPIPNNLELCATSK